MEKASSKFFTITELVCALKPHLAHHDLSQLIQVNHALKNILQSDFWSTVDLQDRDRAFRFLDSPEAIRALAKNAHLVQKLYAGNDFLFFYLQGILNPQNGSSNVKEVVPPLWLPEFTPNPEYTAFLPLFTQLRQFYCKIVRSSELDYNTVPRPTPFIDPLHILWIVNFHPTLHRFIYYGIDYRNGAVGRIAARTVHKLNELTHLELYSPRTVTPRDLVELFYSCPPSLESLKFFAEIRSSRGCLANDVEVSKNDEKVFDGSELELREEPLQKLKTLRLPIICSPKGYTGGSISLILKHCPALESWTAIDFARTEINQSAADAIALHCKGIRHVTVPHQFYCNHPNAILKSLIGLPKDQLETLHWVKLVNYSQTPDLMPQFLQHHSQSLRELRFQKTCFIEGQTVGVILGTCVSLELLVIAQESHRKVSIAPADITESEWVCRDLRHLELIMQTQKNDESDKAESEQGIELIEKNEDALEEFYRRIGQLTKLEFLDLKCQGSSEQDYREVSFPRLLTLGDDATGAKGCLSMLADLTQLKELRGSVRADTLKAKRMMGQREVEWMAERWPALKVAEFLQDDYYKDPEFEVPAHLQWLQKQKPGLRLCSQ